MLGFTVATVVAKNDDKAIAVDAYGNSHRFTKTEVPEGQWEYITESKVVIVEARKVELATTSFLNYSEEVEIV